ncbi:MAG TPA: DUF4878 domain-containing protein [Bacteroidales bacterium]|nr:DUF4878 domain-containing protein [Bacteroidales bacterium]HNZ41711.1 DUF4878 domain-containing protein [Bacteroidales bacterium]HOH83710.1 DUF4878 domain-containing protein [Bacteroidales bacterium]
MKFLSSQFYLILTATVILVVFPLSCKTTSGKENKPAAVAVKFLKHLRAFEFDEARKLGTESTGKMLDMFSMMLELSKEKGKDPSKDKKDVNINVVKTAIDGKNAVVTYKDENGKEQQLDLVKVKGKWLVNMKKETPALSPSGKN